MDMLGTIIQTVDSVADLAIVLGAIAIYRLDKRIGKLEVLLQNGISSRLGRVEARLDSHIDAIAESQ